MKKEEIIEIQKNLIEIYEKEFRKAGVKYPDDYQTTFIGKKIIKLKSELAELSGQKERSTEEMLNKYAKEHPRKYESFVALIENESAIDVYDIVLKFASQFQQEDKISDEVNEPSYSKGEINAYLLSKDEVDETIKKRNQGFK